MASCLVGWLVDVLIGWLVNWISNQAGESVSILVGC